MKTHFKARALFLVTILTLLLVLSCCSGNDNKVTEKEQLREVVIEGTTLQYKVFSVDYYTSKIHYKVFSNGKGHVFVVNITKDSLECIKLRK